MDLKKGFAESFTAPLIWPCALDKAVAFGVAPEDDDGNAAAKAAPKVPKQETPGQIVDMTLALEGMLPEIANALRAEAKKIEGDFYTIGANAALGSWNSFKASAGEQEIEACWKLIDSKTRSGIKNQGSAE